ncbi:MAG: hypothetical protein MUP11_01900, partial [Anaerolineales bacterium]|nr:hypothetical protein [Anaerolineales bacterium]
YKAKYYLGNFYYAHQRFEEAIELWQDAQVGLENYDVLYRNLGLAYWQQKNDLPAAAEAFEKALALNSNNQDLYMLLDELYCLQHENEKREILLNTIRKLKPLREDVRKRAISIMIDLGRYEEVLGIFKTEKFVPLEMDQSFHLMYVRALIQQAEAQIKKGYREQAILSYQQALEYPENHGVGRPTTMGCAEIYFRLGCLYEESGKFKLGIQAWKEAASEHHPFGGQLFEYVQKSLDKLSRYSEIGFEG